MVLSTTNKRREEERVLDLIKDEEILSQEKRAEMIEWANRVRSELHHVAKGMNNPLIQEAIIESSVSDEIKKVAENNTGANLIRAVNEKDHKSIEELMDQIINDPEHIPNIQNAFITAAKNKDVETLDIINKRIDFDGVITPEMAQDVATYGLIYKREDLIAYATTELGIKNYTIDEVLNSVVSDPNMKRSDLITIVENKYIRAENNFDHKNFDHLALRAAYTQAFIQAAEKSNFSALSYMTKNGSNLIDTVQMEESLYYGKFEFENRNKIESALELHRQSVAISQKEFVDQLPIISEAIAKNDQVMAEAKIEKCFNEISGKNFDHKNMFHYYKQHEFNRLLDEAVVHGRKEIVEYMLIKGGSSISNSTVNKLVGTLDNVKKHANNDSEALKYEQIREMLTETSYKERLQVDVMNEASNGKTQEIKHRMIELAAQGKTEEIKELEAEGVVSRANELMPGMSSSDRNAIVRDDLILMAAVRSNQTETAKYLLEKNYSGFIDQYSKRYEEGSENKWREQAQNQISKAFVAAAENGNSELAKHILDKSKGMVSDYYQMKALETAIKNENIDIVQTVMENKHMNQHRFVEKLNGSSIKNRIDADFMKAAKEGDSDKTAQMLKTYYPHLDNQRYFDPKNTYHQFDKVLVEKAIQKTIEAKNKELSGELCKKTDRVIDNKLLRDQRSISNTRHNHPRRHKEAKHHVTQEKPVRSEKQREAQAVEEIKKSSGHVR